MQKIQIRQSMGEIAIEVQKAQIEIKQRKPSLQIKSTPARFTINKKMPSFRLKQNETLAISGYKTILALSTLRLQKARQRTLEAIERIAREGDAIMQIENKVDPIPQIALNNSEEFIDLQVGMMPRNEIVWDTGYVDIDWSPHKTDITWEVYPRPEISVKPHTVIIYLKKKPSVEISVKGDKNIFSFKNRGRQVRIDKKI